MNYVFHTPCSPEANGREPVEGDELFPIHMPTDEGGKVTINMGRLGAIKLCACVVAIMSDDIFFKNEVEQFIKNNSVRISEEDN